jgi:sterol desaturase/sphingolipid hydroxylase (fatty acid hydroxylase superfamily)
MKLIQRIASYSLYPLTLATGIAIAHYLLYGLNLPLPIIAIPLGLAFAVVGVSERLMPYRKHWNDSAGDVATDSFYIVANLLLREIGNVAFKLILLGAFAAIGFHSKLGIWPAEWHPVLQMLLALFVFDFFEYWFHRGSHRFGSLWRFHAIHHSPTRLYFFNAARFHFVDWMALTAIEVVVLLAIGADPKIVALSVVFIQTHGLFQHGNLAVKLGWLNYWVSGPELHRWHHSKLIEESDRNFGNNVIVWDLVFGTYFNPADRQVGVIGLLNPAFPSGYWGQLKAAFAKTPVDKPADFYQREAHYLDQVKLENQREHSRQ